MTLPPCLVAKTKGTGEAEVQRVVGGTSATIVGLSWGASTLETPAAYDTVAHNRVIRFTDGKLYAIIKNSIRENDGLGGAWTENQAAGFSTNNGSSNVAGLYMLDNAGIPTMVVLGVEAGSNNPRTYVSTDGTTWTGTSYATTLGGSTDYGKSIAFRNSIFWCTRNPSIEIVQYDLVSNSVTFYAFPEGLPVNGDFCVFNNTLYLVAYLSGGGNFNFRPALLRFQGGSWSKVQDIGGGSVVNGSTNSMDQRVNHSLYERGGNLYALVCGTGSSGSNAGGFYHFKLTPSGSTFVETDITTATIPTVLRSSSDGGSASSDFRVWTVQNNDTDPASPSYYFQILTTDLGGATSYWEHGGDDATLFSDGSSSVNVAWPEMGEGGGERFYTSGGPSIYCTNMEKTPGGVNGMKLTFHGRGGQTGKTVEVYLNNDEEVPNALATLVAGTVTGGTATNTTALISNIDLDGTVYTVIINTAAASLSNGDKATVSAFIAS